MHLLTRNSLAVPLSIVFICALFSLPAINYFSLRDEILYGIQKRELPLTSDNIYPALQQDFIRPKLIAEPMIHYLRQHQQYRPADPQMQLHLFPA